MFSCFLGLCCQNGGPQRGGSGGISWEPDANADSRPKPPAQASLLLLTARPWHGAGARRHGEHPSRDPPPAGMVTGDACSAPPLGGGTTHGPPGAPVGPDSICPTGRPASHPSSSPLAVPETTNPRLTCGTPTSTAPEPASTSVPSATLKQEHPRPERPPQAGGGGFSRWNSVGSRTTDGEEGHTVHPTEHTERGGQNNGPEDLHAPVGTHTCVPHGAKGTLPI